VGLVSPWGAHVPSAAGLSPALSCPSCSRHLWVLAEVPSAVMGWQTDARGGQSRLQVLMSTLQR